MQRITAIRQLLPNQLLSLLMVALKMLINSKKKFIGMVIGATFSAFIIMQQPSIYQGVTDRTVTQIRSITEADLWVMDKKSDTFEDPTHFTSMDIYRIRSIPGVASAVHVYRTWYQLKHLETNKTMDCELIGVDPKTLLGLPKTMIAGSRESIHHSNSIIIDGYSLKQFETKSKKTIHIGDKMVAGAHTWIVTGITKPLRTYSYHPKVYMASNHIPAVTQRQSFILVKIKPSANVHQIANEIHRITHYDALTTEQFAARSNKFFREKTPIVIGFILTAIVGFSIGLIMIWQIFSNFVLTHLHQFGMLKMLGVSNALLIKMVLFQAAITGGIGYIVGLILTILFGIVTNDTVIAFHITWQIILLGALGATLTVVFSSYFCILKVIRLDTVDLCRDLN